MMSETTDQVPSGQVQTVLGMVDLKQLGPTMMHEHILVDVTSIFEPPQNSQREGPSL